MTQNFITHMRKPYILTAQLTSSFNQFIIAEMTKSLFIQEVTFTNKQVCTITELNQIISP